MSISFREKDLINVRNEAKSLSNCSRVSIQKSFNSKIKERIISNMSNEHTSRITTVQIEERSKRDVTEMNMYKLTPLLNLFIEALPKSFKKDMIITMLVSMNTKNLVFDTTGVTPSISSIRYIADIQEVTEVLVGKVVSELISLGWLKKLNKKQYMVNPYYATQYGVGERKIAQLQLYWDELEARDKYAPVEPIVWDIVETSDNRFETKNDITQALECVKESEAQYKELKELSKKHLEEDKETIRANIKLFKAHFRGFLRRNKYLDGELKDKLEVAVIVHYKNYLKKMWKMNSPEVEYLPRLHLTNTYKPIRLIEASMIKKES